MCYELLSSRARVAIGLKDISVRLKEGDIADLLIMAHTKSITEAVTSAERDRTVLKVWHSICYVQRVRILTYRRPVRLFRMSTPSMLPQPS